MPFFVFLASANARAVSPPSAVPVASALLREKGREARRKFIKYLKVRKRLLSPGAINFHLHFIFVSPCSFVSSRSQFAERTGRGGEGGGDDEESVEKHQDGCTRGPGGSARRLPAINIIN